jgi:two-component system response regulator
VTPPGTVLLVEDDDDDADLLVRAFRGAAIAAPIVRANDGVEALDYLFARGAHAGRDAADLPAVVLLDLKLPRVDGFGVLAALRADPRTEHLPVVVLTSSDEERDRAAAYRGRANSYVQKPIAYARFLDAAAQLGRYWTTLNRIAPATR